MKQIKAFMLAYGVVLLLIVFTVSYFNEMYDVTLFITAFTASLTAAIVHDKMKHYIQVE